MSIRRAKATGIVAEAASAACKRPGFTQPAGKTEQDAITIGKMHIGW